MLRVLLRPPQPGAAAGADRPRGRRVGAERRIGYRRHPVALLRARRRAGARRAERLHDRSISPRRGELRSRRTPGRGRRSAARRCVLHRARAAIRRARRIVCRPLPLSVLTLSTLEQLSELEPDSRFDARRFRMNVIVGTAQRGFVENEWLGRKLAIGDQVPIDVALPDPRCVMPSLAQEELPRDPGVLKALAKHNRIDVAGSLYPCAGIYAVVEATGTIRVDDRVTLI